MKLGGTVDILAVITCWKHMQPLFEFCHNFQVVSNRLMCKPCVQLLRSMGFAAALSLLLFHRTDTSFYLTRSTPLFLLNAL